MPDDFEYIVGPAGLIFEESGPLESPCGNQIANLASQDALRAPCGRVGEGWERMFNEFCDPQKTHFRYCCIQIRYNLETYF